MLRIKEQVLLAFEEGDFQSLPKSGYAQGMLSSYARYLGLNPQQVIDQFSEDLFEFNAETPGSGSPRRRTTHTPANEPIYELPNTGASSVRTASSRYQPAVNASDPAGYRTVTSRPGRGSQGAGWRGSGDQGHGVTPSSSWQRPSSDTMAGSTRRPSSSQTPSTQGYPQGRPYTGRMPRDSSALPTDDESVEARRAARQARRAARQESSAPVPSQPASGRTRAVNGDITTRRVTPSQYRDDLRYDDTAHPYEAASTQAGRRSSRNIVTPERPNVRRRQPDSYQRQLQSRGASSSQAPRSGVAGVIEAYFSDTRRTIFTMFAVLAIALMVIIVVSVRSCTTSTTSTGKQVSVATSSASTASASTVSATQQAAEQAALSAAVARSATTEAATETDVVVTVADGQVTWLEVQCDGESKVAETITGPWSASYVVTSSITIQVADTTAVSVTNNGTAVQFDSKTSGLGKLTIQGTSPATTSAATTSDATTAQTSAQTTSQTKATS
ncbi:MAG: helix-turn-helix domain-containing protein [Atopobiaceae bacterium]|nr:helix-turn-helix domain-containing protein [Atopobiaceae bacterium]MCH4180898.1 helix-turn-helix domain-containing protein [Atopobiaceae bacterium]MCH4213981.1 helix-turn-helix domain-containing protein [Atopobiaceae bacterium]MCH4230633.1 helix-turn-helix domain-containing protein [Atopobiaceae bacterium]MCH4275556.1 helix-turn-helix domain-containing protein [Atopobiaceae bacterium]